MLSLLISAVAFPPSCVPSPVAGSGRATAERRTKRQKVKSSKVMLGFHASGIGGERRSQSVASHPSRHTTACEVIGYAVCRAANTACMETQFQVSYVFSAVASYRNVSGIRRG